MIKTAIASGALLPSFAFAYKTQRDKARGLIKNIIEHGKNFSNLYVDKPCKKPAFNKIYQSVEKASKLVGRNCFYKNFSCKLNIPFEISQLFFTNDPAYALPLATKVSEKISKKNGKKGYKLTLEETLWRKTNNGNKEVGFRYFGTDNKKTFGDLDMIYGNKSTLLFYSRGTFKGFPAETVNLVRFSDLEKKTEINFDLFVWPNMEKKGKFGKIVSSLIGKNTLNKIVAGSIDSKIDEKKLKEKILDIFFVAQDTSNFILENPQILLQPNLTENKEELIYLRQIINFCPQRAQMKVF